MKTLIVLGVGVVLGFALKKSEKIKESNFVIVDEREKLGEHLFGPEGKEAFAKFFKQNKSKL